MADPSFTGSFSGVVRCACGVLGCIAAVGASSFVMVLPAEAAPEPGPQRALPVECRLALRTGDRRAWRSCREAWRAMHDERQRAVLERQMRKRRAKLTDSKPPQPPPEPRKRQSRPSPRLGKPSPATSSLPPAPPPTPTQNLAKETTEAGSLPPLLLLGLLLPAAAAIGYPMRHRIYSMACASFLAPAPATAQERAEFTYRPAIDPFAVPLLGLAGAGAADTARVMTLIALEDCGDSAIVVIPRPDATALFGLAEDDLLDETGGGLFIPGNLDAALASMETELAIRRNAGGPQTRRLLLVADCAKELDRINELCERHPDEFGAILLGDWPGARITVDGDGLVEAPPALAGALPERLPAMSRTEARDRLYAAIQRHRPTRAKLPRGSRQRRR
ncbi:hypothetical protein GCM10023085_76210 [Actinomadura viridis]|uniref:Uncharacterized protein n=1 Tax=Actinomadura viridis TaxID=58110 RepID=A0A931GJ69_9ACTN|nr:hypothetical protein [Actinomadura viridis]MBG6088970.1 hypothetical protein [Actinomadura viridis]